VQVRRHTVWSVLVRKGGAKKQNKKKLQLHWQEVQLQLEGAPTTWIPVETLIALVNLKDDIRTKTYSSTSTD
jgi:hypothetical protein